MSDNTIRKCPKCGEEMWLLQYSYDHPAHWDGWSEYTCPRKGLIDVNNNYIPDAICGVRMGRWSLDYLTGDQYEPVGGKKRK